MSIRKSQIVNGLMNILNTLLEEDFREFINDKWRSRERKVINNKNLGITAKEKFIEIFKNSRSVSTSRGKTYFLARKPKARIEERKEFNFEDTGRLTERIEELLGKIHEYEFKEEEASKHKESLAKLYERRIVNSDGEYVEEQ